MTRRMMVPLLFGLAGAAILFALGMWQVQRLQWKRGVIADIEARVAAPPVALPAAPEEAGDEYLAVRISGRSDGEDVLVLISAEGFGTGYRVVTPFVTATGRRVLVDRGFIAERRKNEPRPPLVGAVTGNLLWPDEVDVFVPPPEGRLWFARDLPAMARALQTEEILLVLRSAEQGNPGVRAMPINAANIPNDHLNYAITWFLLMIGWLGMTGYWLWRIRRQTDRKGA